jgi:hypothetical protein
VCENPDSCTDELFRPVSNAARVGAQIAVVWKLVKRTPCCASASKLGVAIAPPKALEAPKPTSSIRIHTTLGEPAGGRTGSGHHSFESASVRPTVPW